VSGWIDCDELKPTAGRDTLDNPSVALLGEIFRTVETAAGRFILEDADLLAAHVRLIPDFVRQGFLERLGLLAVDVIGGARRKLQDIRKLAGGERKIFYSQLGQSNATTEVLGARGHVVVRLSGNAQRRSAEIAYLQTYCHGQELDSLIECLEAYTELDSFERSVVSELQLAIRKLFQPPEFRLVAGKLTLDSPIFWSGKQDGGAVLVFVDPRHGEFQKLRPLGYSALFWSMIEAFCREYLGDTLKRQSPKFFGSGAVDLEAFSKAHSELWELVVSDIEVSRIGMPKAGTRSGGGRIEVIGKGDIASLTIPSGGGAVVESDPDGKKTPKLLQIVDETGETGLSGYYLRIPESATAAFGKIITTFPSFAVVWFANRVTWQGTDLSTTAFLLDVTLDRLLASDASGGLAHGSMEIPSSRLQVFGEQIFFFIPEILQDRVVPQEEANPIKIEVRHELVDLNRSRSWRSKDAKSD
jgi:hypothetical protein